MYNKYTTSSLPIDDSCQGSVILAVASAPPTSPLHRCVGLVSYFHGLNTLVIALFVEFGYDSLFCKVLELMTNPSWKTS